MNKIFNNRKILITGGTGSFGSYFVKEILTESPRLVIIYSRDEDKQYSLQFELKKYKDKSLTSKDKSASIRTEKLEEAEEEVETAEEV